MCTLGVPLKRAVIDDTDPYLSKIGGSPAFHSSCEISSRLCGSCGSPLSLICQIYAPTEQYHRSLYILACISECSQTSTGWCVLRNQSPLEPAACVENSKTTEEVPKAATCWDDDEVDMDDLEQLIATSTAMAAAPTTSQAPKLSSTLPSVDSSCSNICWVQPIEVDLQDDEVEEGRGTSREDQLLAEYLASEEAEDVRILQSALSAATNAYDAKHDDNESDGEDDDEGEELSCEAIAKGNATKDIFETKFQRAINRVPKQVLRYDYEGKPLLRAALPDDFSIPNCICGAQRCFEMQLLPTIINFIKLAKNAVKSESKKFDLDSFDFGTVLVYTCPNSCNSSDKEFVAVQAPIS